MLERVEINDEAARELLKSAPIKADLKRRADRIAAAAGVGQWDVTESNSRSRARVSVGTGDYKAREAEATNRVLLRALEAGRG